MGAVFYGMHAIDQHVLDAGGEGVRLGVGRQVGDGVRIEDRDVGGIAGDEQAAFLEFDARGRQAGAFPDGRGQVEDLVFPDELLEEAREGAVRARVREFLAQRAFGRVDAAVGGGHREPVRVDLLQVVFLHGEGGLVDREFFGDEQVADHLPFVHAGNLAALGQVLAGVDRVGRVVAAGHYDLLRAAEALEAAVGVGLDLFAGRRVVEAGVDVFRRAVAQLDGNERREPRGEGGVRIAVEGDVDARVVGVVDLLEHPVDLVEVGRILGLEVGDFQAGARFAGGGDGFVHGFEHVVVLIAHMDGVEGVVLFDHFVERHHFLGVAIAAGGIFQAVRQAYGAQRELAVEHLAHFPQIVRGGFYVVGTDHGFAHVAVAADEGHIAVDVTPGRAAVPGPVFAAFPGVVAVDEGAVAAVAAQIGGDALEDAAVALGRVEQVRIGVGVDIDETGRDDQSFRVDDVVGTGAEVFAQGGNFAVADRDVAGDGRFAVAGIDDAVLDERVEKTRNLGMRSVNKYIEGVRSGKLPEYDPEITFFDNARFLYLNRHEEGDRKIRDYVAEYRDKNAKEENV